MDEFIQYSVRCNEHGSGYVKDAASVAAADAGE
jgi:hypothetical protein